ncbi:MAG: PilZ domain-containing protein [Phycisphaeraceae bacterium]
MPSVGDTVRLQLPSLTGITDAAAPTALSSGLVAGINGSRLTVVLDKPQACPPAGGTVTLFFFAGSDFLRQQGRLDVVTLTAEELPRPILGIDRLDAPVSAESRQAFRITGFEEQVCVRIEKERNCPMVDVSLTGIAIVTRRRYPKGLVAMLEFIFQGQPYAGRARIQNLRELPDEHFRYGLQAAEERSFPGNLKKGLQALTLHFQRVQLRERRGA